MPRINFISLIISIFLIISFSCQKPNNDAPVPPVPDSIDSLSAPQPLRHVKINGQLNGVLLWKDGSPYKANYGIVGIDENNPYSKVPDNNGFFSFVHPATNEDATILHTDFYYTIPISAPVILQKDRIHFIKKRVISIYSGDVVPGTFGKYGAIGVYPGNLDFEYGDSSWMNISKNTLHRDLVLNCRYVRLGSQTGNLDELQPGDMRGINSRNEMVVINPFIMVGFTATDNSADKIDIAPGKKILASVLIPSIELASAPSTSTVWEYDLKEGFWMEAGTAIREGDRYLCHISKKGYFCVAEQSPAVFVHLKFVDRKGNPLSFIQATITQPTPGRSINEWPNGLYTNSTGELSTYVPYNKVCRIVLREPCSSTGAVKTIGPITGSLWKTLEVVMPATNSCLFEGKAFTCDMEPMKKGAVLVKTGGFEYAFPIKDGKYSFNVSVCLGNVAYEYKIYDSTTLQTTAYAPLVPVKGGTINLPDAELCIDQTRYVTGDIVFTVEGGTHTMNGATDSVFIRSYIDLVTKKRTTFLGGFNNKTHYKFGVSYTGETAGNYNLYTCTAGTPAHRDYLMAWGWYSPGTINVTELDFKKGIMRGTFSTTINRSTTQSDITQISGTFNVKLK